MAHTYFEQVLEHIFTTAKSTSEQGTAFEKATVYYLKNDPLYQDMFSDVWLWQDSPTKTGQDIGIDLVAKDATDGSYWAIQCKCYQEDATLTYKALSTFFATAAAEKIYDHYMIVDTANAWTHHLQEVADKYHTVKIGADDMRESDLDWTPFLTGKGTAERVFFEARPHQEAAIEKVIAGFETADRGKLIMACGTGKTLTALRLVEKLCPKGMVLFLAPSISLVSQTLRAWANQSKGKLRPFIVCSDTKASNVEDIWETSLSEVPFPATTDPDKLAKQVRESQRDGELTVVFSTYQSIQVVIDAQHKGMGVFDLCICDEAHRTTGVADTNISKQEQSAFVKVHDASMLKAKKRLYMTATPRIYSTNAKRKAHEESYEISSMDDVEKYGEEFYRLSFGRAVELGLLSDYRVIVLTVSEAMASQVYQQTMFEEGGFDVPEVAKILGVWKGLATRGAKTDVRELMRIDLDDGNIDYEEEVTAPMHRAVAFTSTIAESQRLAGAFQDVVDAYIEKSGAERSLFVETHHVDGTMDSNTRKGRLRWLEESPGDDICRVLTNAKCLSEGIDVPDLDAVIFMKPRNSQIDIIQAVGRVMRKAPYKRFGYIILPVVVPAGMSPEEALDDDKAFAVVWQILQALRSHDERLDARINSLVFKGAGDGSDEVVRVSHFGDDDDEFLQAKTQEKLELVWTEDDWQNAMEAKLVKKCGTRVYWDDWADDVAGIAQRHIALIRHTLDNDEGAYEEFGRFLAGLRDSLNPGITEEAAIEMLAQHMITLPIFDALFGGEFASSNPVSIAMEEMLAILNEHKIANREDDEILQTLYDSVKARVAVVQSDQGRQAIVKELYEGFFSKAFKSTSQKMGIVYTPSEVVEYILRATDRALKEEFGVGLGSPGVHILDPFAGTGTFMAELISSDIISDEQLPHKYIHEMHSNEILLLAYYIMTINIEQAYHARMGGDYLPFEGAVLTDTFQMTEEGDTLDVEVFTDNSERVVQQNDLDIRVIVGNPPYSVGQKSANDDNANEDYPTLDARIANTYAANTNATNKNSLYDSYIRAFRWASERILDEGIICFVSNAGWLDAAAMDGFRKCLTDEFNSIYVFNLRGNARTSGESRRKEKDNVFGEGTRTPIAITMLVKNPKSEEHGQIFYYDIGDYLSREAKLAVVKRAARDGIADWQTIRPDRHNDWLNQRDDSWYEFAPIAIAKRKKPSGIFQNYAPGVQTNRDSWLISFSKKECERNTNSIISNYNNLLEETNKEESNKNNYELIDKDTRFVKWSPSLIDRFNRGESIDGNNTIIRKMTYRPFCKQFIGLNVELIHRPGIKNVAFPAGSEGTLSIAINYGKSVDALITNEIPDQHLVGDSQCFPLYWYEKKEDIGGLFASEESEYIRHDGITDEALAVFRNAYPYVYENRKKKDGGPEITKEDIFYYIYGILHSTEYRERFAANLMKVLMYGKEASNRKQ